MITTKPILFSTPMVKALLKNQKMMTRRIWDNNFESVGAEPCDFDKEESLLEVEFTKHLVAKNGKIIDECMGDRRWIKCPYGKIGDKLWVRETFSEKDGRLIYRADVCSKHDLPSGFKWKASIFMPRSVSRITLKITNIRFERLQDISNADAKAEGASDVLSFEDIRNLSEIDKDCHIKRPFLEYQFGFMALWAKINGVKSWTDNPYVWVIEFEKEVSLNEK